MKKILFVFVGFISSSVMADVLINNDIVNGCDKAYSYSAVYEPNTYNCSVGTYLPASAIACENCPSGHNCDGGIFSFNPIQTQGLNDGDILTTNIIGSCGYDGLGQDFSAIFTPNQYTCSAGYYLPADGVECTQCPRNNYCTGGTYTFNETTDQGIEPCPINTPHAPTGSAVCYPHILHIGENNVYLKSTKLTTPSLNIAIEGSIFYANLTTTPTYMNKDSEQSLKIMVNGIEYYVCDDTTCPSAE